VLEQTFQALVPDQAAARGRFLGQALFESEVAGMGDQDQGGGDRQGDEDRCEGNTFSDSHESLGISVADGEGRAMDAVKGRLGGLHYSRPV
jgi:hypothetical protein